MLLRQKMLKFFITHKNQDLKKSVLYGGGSFAAYRRIGLHSRGSVCLANQRGLCLHSGGTGVRGFPPSLPHHSHFLLNVRIETEPISLFTTINLQLNLLNYGIGRRKLNNFMIQVYPKNGIVKTT